MLAKSRTPHNVLFSINGGNSISAMVVGATMCPAEHLGYHPRDVGTQTPFRNRTITNHFPPRQHWNMDGISRHLSLHEAQASGNDAPLLSCCNSASIETKVVDFKAPAQSPLSKNMSSKRSSGFRTKGHTSVKERYLFGACQDAGAPYVAHAAYVPEALCLREGSVSLAHAGTESMNFVSLAPANQGADIPIIWHMQHEVEEPWVIGIRVHEPVSLARVNQGPTSRRLHMQHLVLEPVSWLWIPGPRTRARHLHIRVQASVAAHAVRVEEPWSLASAFRVHEPVSLHMQIRVQTSCAGT